MNYNECSKDDLLDLIGRLNIEIDKLKFEVNTYYNLYTYYQHKYDEIIKKFCILP